MGNRGTAQAGIRGLRSHMLVFRIAYLLVKDIGACIEGRRHGWAFGDFEESRPGAEFGFRDVGQAMLVSKSRF